MKPLGNATRTRLRRVALALVCILVGPIALARDLPNVAAASDLKFALDEIAAAFHDETGLAVAPTFSSSGNLYRQILQGAPFELFLSADEAFVDNLARAGRTLDAGTLYAIGRLVLFSRKDGPFDAAGDFAAGSAALADALARGAIRNFAIANPEHAPYGRAAREALQRAGLWDAIQGRLVIGENVAQAAQFAISGSADGGIFAYSHALAPEVAARGNWVPVPEEFHAPLRQRMVRLKDAGPTARAFYDYLQTETARAILVRHGFTLPEPAP
ncbi:MAG: molybdate ABC transporter substrate-binding protein [Pseudomonadales bacterium]|nr:molybdate ABC transporter substrate-binding protein [Pseudomonadales bacterium]